MTAKIIEFPGPWRYAPETALREDALARSVLKLVIESADENPHPTSLSVCADATLADLHRLITQHLGWDSTHNYFFSQGSCRYEDPLLFNAQDPLSARCRRIYCAADLSVGFVLVRSSAPLYYMYNLTNGRELKITLDDAVALEVFG